jgi:hypothetical protein
MAEKKKKQTSFGQFDTGGAVARQRTSDRGREAAEEGNRIKDRATKIKRQGGARNASERNSVATDDARRRKNADRVMGATRRDN